MMMVIKGKTVNWHRQNKTVYGSLYKRFHHQLQRCGNPNDHRYHLYGAKGIKVEYTFQELVDWYDKHIDSYKGGLDEMNIGRIDHDKGYSLDNIQLETKSENSKERNMRNPNKKKPVIIFDYATGEPLMAAESVCEAARLVGDTDSNVCRVLKGNRRSARGCTFEYASAGA